MTTPIPEGPGSVSGAPNLPEGFADTFTSRYVDAGDVRLHAVVGGERSATPARPRLAPDLVRVAIRDAGAGEGLRGDRGRPARHRTVRQARGRLRRRHPRGRPGRTDGGPGPPAVRVVRHRYRHADRPRPGHRPPRPGRAPDRLGGPAPGGHTLTAAVPPTTTQCAFLAPRVQPAPRGGERGARPGDGRTSSSARSSTPRPGRTSCPPMPSGTTSTRSPPTPIICAAASGSTGRSPRRSPRTRSARRGVWPCPSSRSAARKAPVKVPGTR